MFFRVKTAECSPVNIVEADGRPARCYVLPGNTVEEEAERQRKNVAEKLRIPTDEVEVVKNYLLVVDATEEEGEMEGDVPVEPGDSYVFNYVCKKAIDEKNNEEGSEDEELDFSDKNVVREFVRSQRRKK